MDEPKELNHAIKIVRGLQQAGYIAYLAGGCVRDRLLGRMAKDFDVVTSANSDEILSLFEKSHRVGSHFSIVLVKMGEGTPAIEVATFRGEDSLLSGAREDAFRRDFTLNAIFWDPIEDALIDEVGGQRDLGDRVLRCCGDAAERFAADPLRILRAIRFVTALDFSIEQNTWLALCSLAPSLDQVSPERISAELGKIWQLPNRLRAFDLMVDSGIMGVLLPEVLELRGCEQPPRFHPEGDVFVHTRLVLKNLPAGASLALVWSAILHDIAKPATSTFDERTQRIRFLGHAELGARMVTEILGRLKCSNHLTETVSSVVSKHMVFYQVKGMKNSKLRRLMAEPYYSTLLALHKADSLGGKGDLSRYHFMLEVAAGFENAPLIPKPLLNGRDVLDMGVEPGSEVGKVLKRVQDLQLDGILTTREQALTWISQWLEDNS